jgi:lipopolysaccharide transport system permease protein
MGEWLSEVWRAREILYFLAWRDVKVRYKQAALGIAWAVLQPLFTMIVFTFFFGRLARIPSEGVPYPLFSYSALVLWTYFSVTLSQVGNSLVSNSSLITKIYFPRVLMPGAAAFGGLLDLVVSSLFLAGMLIYYHVTPRWTLLLTPIFVAQTVLLVLGVGMLLAAVNVRYRDVKYTIPFLTQIGLFVTPIIYPVTFLPHRFQSWLAWNPMTGVIDGFRACLFGSHVDTTVLACSWIVTLLLLLIGGLHFRSTERVFADIV